MSWRRVRRRLRRRGGVLVVAGVAVFAAATVTLVGFALVPKPLPPETPHATMTAQPRSLLLDAVGDSYTAGSDMGGYGTTGWASIVATGYKQRTVLLNLAAEGGAGYAQKGTSGTTLPEHWAANGKPGQDVVVVFAGLNDKASDPNPIKAAASKLYADIRKASPKAILVVVGPAWPNQTPSAGILAVRDAIKDAAAGAGAQFVDPIADGWFMGTDHRLIGADGTHPTDEGHKYMADKLAPIIDADLDKARAS